MATVTTNYAGPASEAVPSRVDRVRTILYWTYGLVPIVAGADKFSNILTDWSQYLAPIVTDIIPLSPQTFMSIVGVIEIRNCGLDETKNWKSCCRLLACCYCHQSFADWTIL
jgi:hypothetical protein